jgi:type II secretory pathway pseudopilin PulG
MAALLVMMAVAAVLMSAALPVWRHEAQREKEEELIWRGQQYVRAIRLFNAKTQAFPPSIDVLVQQHYLRRKYKDPITNDDFQVLSAGSPIPGQAGQANLTGQPRQSANQPVVGGIIGVVSKSKDESIRIYLGRTHYNEWTFLYVNQRPGGVGNPGGPGAPGFPGRGGRGGPDGRGGRGGRGGPGDQNGPGGFGGRGFGNNGGRNPFPQGPGIGPGRGTGSPVVNPFPGRGRGGGG